MAVLDLKGFPFMDIYLVMTREEEGRVEFFGAWSSLEDAQREANRRYNGVVLRFGLDNGPDDYGYME